MITLLVQWHIRNECKSEFLKAWNEIMKPLDTTGLYYEILTEVNTESSDARYHSLDLENPHYSTFINIGIWREIDDFEKAIGGFLPPIKEVYDEDAKENKVQILMNKYEYKLRDRIVLNVEQIRKGGLEID